MAADVIEVDFNANRLQWLSLPERADELLVEADELLVGVQAQIGQITRDVTFLERQRELERWHVGVLSRKLAQERAASFPFGDDDVLTALRAVYTGEPVSASTIANALYGRKATHSAGVRVGLALHRLRAAGGVQAAVPPTRSVATRWRPVDRASDDA